MDYSSILERFMRWAWELITGVQPLIDWLFEPIEILSFEVAPIYLVGAGLGGAVLIAGILRAIL